MKGRLSYGEKLPSARELASTLLISRNPVDTAYEQLMAEGYVYSLPQKGYYVNEITYIKEYGQEEEKNSPCFEEREEYMLFETVLLWSRDNWLYLFRFL